MPKVLRGKLCAIFVFLVVFSFKLSAQVGCGSFSGAPQPSGGITSDEPGSLCLNDPIQIPATIDIKAINVADGSNPNNFAVVIDWDDGSPLQTVTYGGATPITYTAATHEYLIDNIPHVFLPKPCNATMGRQCAYKPRIYLRIAGVTCPAEFGNPPDFFRYNTDDQCSGNMVLSETLTGAAIYEVCAGATTNVTFTDRTIINCLPPQELTGLNSTRRWRRFTYGTFNDITEGGPTEQVLINGTDVGFPYMPSTTPDVSANNLATSAAPFGNNNTLSITIPATAQVGDEFHIRMEYWNICNVYDDGVGVPPPNGDRPSVFRDGIIRVVGQPAPPTPLNEVVCNNISGNLPDFAVDFTAGSSRVFWFRDNNGVKGSSIANPNGSNNKTFPVSAYPGGINKSTPGVYRMWARYRSRVNNAGLFCESIDVPVTITIRPEIPDPIFSSGTSTVCNGTNGVAYSLQIPANALSSPDPGNPAVSFSTEYFWSASVGGVTITSTNPGQNATAQTATVNFNIPNGTFGGAPSINVDIQVVRRYTTNSTFPAPGSNCPSDVVTFPVTVFRNTDVGSLSGGATRCQGEDLGNISWTPGIGSIQRWEISDNGGGSWTTIPGFGTSTTVNPNTLGLLHTGAPAVPTEYLIRAQVQNGNCPMLPTAEVTFLINENADPAAAGPDQPLCAVLTTSLAATNATGTWSVISGPGNVTTLSVNNPTSTFTVDTPGIYELMWTTSNGTCTSQDNVIITFGEAAGIPVPVPDIFCGKAGTLTAAAPTQNETVTWVVVGKPFVTSTASITDPTSVSSAVTVSDFGLYTFEITFSSPASCSPDETVQVDYSFFESPTSLPEANKTVCVDGSVAPIAGIPVTGTSGGGTINGRWERVTGSGTFFSSGAANGNSIAAGVMNDSYIPSNADYANGSVTLRLVTFGNPVCPNATANLVLTFDRLPAPADAGVGPNTCGDAAILAAVAPTEGGIGTWNEITAGPSVDSPSNRNSPVSDLIIGINTFQWQVESLLKVCPATTDNVDITRYSLPVANALTADNLCETVPNSGIAQDVDLTQYNNGITGGAANVLVEWYTNAGLTLDVPDVNSHDVKDPLFVRVTRTDVVPACESSTVVVFDIKQPPFISNLAPAICEDLSTPGAVQNVDLLSYNDDVSLNLWPGSRTVDWYVDAGLTTLVTNPSDQDNVLDNATYYARVADNVTGCYSSAEVIFNVNPIPVANPIVGPNTICFDPTNVIFFKVTTLNPNHSYKWTIPPPSDGVTNTTGIDTDFFVLLQFATVVPGGLPISVVETSPEGCVGPTQQIVVEIEDSPNALTITGPDEVCEGDINVQFDASNFPDINYLWNVPPGASIVSGANTSTILVNFGSTPGDVTVVPSTVVGCTGSGFDHPVAINLKPILANLDKTICSKELSGLQLATSGTEPAATYNIITRIDDAGLFQVNPPVTFPLNNAPVDVLENDAFGNVTGGPLNARYTIEPVSAKGCVGPRGVVTLKINPEPQLDPDLGKNLCSEEATSITLRAAVGSAVADRFVINSISSGGMTSVNPPPTLNTQYPATAIFTDQWIYTGSTFGTVQYEIAPVNFATGCVGTPSSMLEVRVFPIPELALPGPVTICSGEGQNISLSVPNITTPTVTISSTVSFIDPNISGAQSHITTGLSATIPEVLMNSGFVNPGIVQYSITAENRVTLSKSCYSAPQVLEVTVNPIPDANVLDPLQGCATVLNSGIYTATLADIEPLITTGNTVAWYEQDPLVNPGATLITTPTYDFQDMVPVFAEVSNAFSCRQVVPVVHDVNNAVVLALTEDNISCNGFQDGEITANASFGSPPFFFQKDSDPFVASAGNSFTYSGLISATYDITVRDSKGCLTTVTSALIQEPTPLVFNNVEAKDVDCFFDASQVTDRNGEIKITVSGSSGNYQYQLFPGPVTNNTGVFSTLRPGSYAIVVSDVGNSACKLENSPVIIGVPERVEITQISIPVDSYGNEISCNGAENGEVHITSRGGTGSYFVTLEEYNPPDAKPAVLNVPVIFDRLAAGFYKISVEDTKGCKAPNTSATIRDIPKLTPGKIGIDQNVCFNQNDLAGDVDEFIELVSPFGGSGPYEYIWQQSTQPSPPPGSWFDIAGATTTTYDPDPLGGGVNSPYTQPGNYYYRRLIRNTPPPISLNTRPSFCDDYKGQDDIVTVTVQPAPSVSVVGDGIACQGDDKFYQLRLDNGSAPMTFTWDDGEFTLNNETANILSAPYKVSDIQQMLTVGFSNIRDAYGCMAPDATIQIDVTTISADFAVDPTSGCAGDAFAFTHPVNNLLDYTWNFGDGSADLIRPAGTSTGSETYTYDPAITAQGDAKFFVTFKAQEQGGGCFKIETKEVTVFRTLNLSLSNPPPAICVGESFKITDKSIGVTSGVYYYADVNGNNRGPDIQGPLPDITFTLPDPPNNGDEYYIYYEAQNSNNCPAEQVVGPVKVFRSVTADFNINPNPAKMIAGQVEVDFINTSVPLDNTIFEYRWDYPIVDVVSVTDPNPYDKHVVFSSEKEQEVTLTVFNMARPECRSTHLEILEIDLEGALADFLVTRAGCTPLHVTTKNLSVSFDIFEWELTSTVGVTETSQLTEPQFDLNQPGTYYLVLKASKAGNSIAPMVTLPKAIEVLARPRAEFFFRTNEVYVGSQLKPVNETVDACDGCWNWDFGDGFTYNNVFEPTHNYSLEGKYPVKLEAWFDHGQFDVDDDGVLDGSIVCNDIEEKEIRVIEGGKIKIPNAFTPNVNGSNGGNPDNNFTNDVFLPIMDGVEEFTMQIFDRWGNLIFQSKEKNVGWDGYDENGKLMPAGVYVYKVVLRLGDGERTTKVGDVTLIR